MAKHKSGMLELKNPHSVYEAIKKRPVDVIEIVVRSQKPEGMWEKVIELAKTSGIAVRSGSMGTEPKQSRQRGKTKADAFKQERAGTAFGIVKSKHNDSLDTVLHNENPDANGLWLALDCLQDPHNVGAIFRTAAFFGVKGMIVTQDRSAPMNGTVYDVATGGVEHVPFSVETNLSRALSKAKDSGLWILGASEHAEQSISEIKPDRPWLLVIGNEEKGIRRLTRDHCDMLCSVPAIGNVTSLNASSAAAVMISNLTPVN